MPASGLHLAFAAALTLLPLRGELAAQRIVRETANQYAAVRPLVLVAEKRWCEANDEKGCDFRSIDNAILLPNGGVVMSQVPGPMWLFGPDGKAVRALSAKGQGPGEYGFIAEPRLVGDRIVWFDNTQMRITSVSLKNVPGPVTATMMPMTTGGIFMIADTLVVLDVPPSNDQRAIVNAVYRTVTQSGLSRVLARVKMQAMFRPGSSAIRPTSLLGRHPVYDVGPNGGVAHSNGESYTVDVFPVNGDSWRLEASAPLRAVTRYDRDSLTAQTLKAFRSPNVQSLPPMIRQQLNDPYDTFPALTAIRVLRDGTIWIRPISARGSTVARWDVFSALGIRIGQTQLPVAARLRDGTKDWILVAEKNADDVPTLVKYLVR